MDNRFSFDKAIDIIEKIMVESDLSADGSDSILGRCSNTDKVAEASMTLLKELELAKATIISSIDLKGQDRHSINILFNFEA